jgi:hypothetical protein
MLRTIVSVVTGASQRFVLAGRPSLPTQEAAEGSPRPAPSLTCPDRDGRERGLKDRRPLSAIEIVVVMRLTTNSARPENRFSEPGFDPPFR